MRLNEYKNQELLARICYSIDEADRNRTMGRNVLYLEENIATLMRANRAAKYIITGCCNFRENDTIFINKYGNCRLLFRYSEYSQTIIVTNKCNSNCIMCPYTSHFRASANDCSDDFLVNQIDYLPTHTEQLTITGGEPTLKKEGFFRLMEKIKTHFPQVSCLLLTNGRSFSLRSICCKSNVVFPKKIIAAVPLHASYAELHDAITQVKNSFTQTAVGIRNLLNLGIAVEIRIVVFKENYKDIINISKFIQREIPNVSIVNFMAAEMCGNAAKNQNNTWVSYNKAFANCEKAIDLLISLGIDVGIYNFPLCSVPRRYWGIYKRSISSYKIRYGKKCDICNEKNVCGGVFASSLKYAESEMQPILEKL